jgi:hypothetical protein
LARNSLICEEIVMRSSLSHRLLAGAAAAAVLSVALGAGGAGAQVQQRPAGPAGSTVLTSHLPDLMPTNLGFLVADFVAWGSTGVIDKPHLVGATQVGPNKNLCHFPQAAYRTFNKGDGDAGAFVTKTHVGGALANTHNVPGGLASKDFIDWHKFPINLAEGMNVIRVIFDTNKQVSETDENNTFQVRINVKVDCDGDGKVGGVANPAGGLKQAPGKPDPDPAPTRTLRLKPAN